MPLTELDINKLSKLISPHVDQVTCIECCKCYLAPSTAPCGHTLCHGCWVGRKKCATCGANVNRKSLKLNLPLQKITEHTQALREEFEKIFKINLEEFLFDTPIEREFSKDPSKNVKDWLANSENQFSAPDSIQHTTQDFINQQNKTGSQVQIHSETTKANSTKNIIYVGTPQDDWDKIEEMPDTEEQCTKNKENAIGPMDIEPFTVDSFEFPTDKPRRSSRKRDGKGNMLLSSDINSVDQNSTKESAKGGDTKLTKQNWANVKRMKKEFSKLNKKSKNKLNVSIEMCKKTLHPSNKIIPVTTVNNLKEPVLNIEDNTPNIGVPIEGLELNKHLGEPQISNKNVIKCIGEVNLNTDMECETQRSENIEPTIENTNFNARNRLYTSIQSQTLNPKNDQVTTVPFIVKSALQTAPIEDNFNYCENNYLQSIIVNTDNVEKGKSTEDIEITIKIGNTVTNICIKKKEDNVKLKINADREVQTSLEQCIWNNKNNAPSSPIKISDPENNVAVSIQNNQQEITQNREKFTTIDKVSTVKTSLSKKNTESADTATAQYEITESIEKELSKEMEKEDIVITENTSNRNKKGNVNKQGSENDILDDDCLNDLDIFDNVSVKEGNIHLLKSSNHAPSEILISTIKSNKSKKQVDKRDRDTISDELPISKKMKIIHESNETGEIAVSSKTIQSNNLNQNSELDNYDVIMGKVFANIDSDLARNKDEREKKNSQLVEMKSSKIEKPHDSKVRSQLCYSIHGQSENVFSLLEKENDVFDRCSSLGSQANADNLTEPTKPLDHIELIDPELSTPINDINDHSDESIVEETPQKNASFQKLKQKSGGSLNAENTVKNKSLRLKRSELVSAPKSSNTPNIMSVINLSDITDDTTRKTKHITILEASKCRPTLETPLTITNFVDQIKHKSTPMAKKSLNFDNDHTETSDMDPEQTLCPNSFLVARTTQEKEFMCKAFEESPRIREKSPLTMLQRRVRPVKYSIAGSCLTPSEISNVKHLCSLRNWDYLDKYSKDLTHLVVGVDDENKSQRSVKYMCALAASKWIVSYEWVQKCLQMKTVVDEEPYEALDNTGEPGPQRSRLAKQKLFQGITFFCMPPFSVLDVDTLKGMLEAAGGRVVDEAKAVRATSDSIALLLAEPEHTQENRFIYLAMELSIVPVNSEWVLNCLGSYTISSVLELLLCPESLLPPATAHWPPDLLAKEFD